VRPIYRTGTPLPSRHPILYIFSTNIRTEFFKHAAHSPFNAVYFIMLPFLVFVLFALYIQSVLKFKCQIPVQKGYAARGRVCKLCVHSNKYTIMQVVRYTHHLLLFFQLGLANHPTITRVTLWTL
jgi:hypothetical protein